MNQSCLESMPHHSSGYPWGHKRAYFSPQLSWPHGTWFWGLWEGGTYLLRGGDESMWPVIGQGPSYKVPSQLWPQPTPSTYK